MTGFIIGILIGGVMGFVFTALCIAGKWDDEC